ncbi:MAG: hypothetical protein A3K77_04165 [Euryarchaeota archaeon RBG_13_31_8]|nr:MAG: hypothetical protein A3K77_04165 [Euryarchaeota archaeon RBG_13_31_8]
MKKFKEITDEINIEEITKQLKVYNEEISKVLKTKYKNNAEIGIVAGTCLKYLRFVRTDTNTKELMAYLSDLFELEELVDAYNGRSFFNSDVESKINKFVLVHKQKIVTFLNWFKSVVQEEGYETLIFSDEDLG